MNKTGAAYLAASFLTSNRVAAIAADYVTWIDAQAVEEQAVNALLAASRCSKSPTRVLAQADAYYDDALFEVTP